MTRFFHGLTLFVTLACLGLLGDAAWAAAPVGAEPGRCASDAASRASAAKPGRRAAQRKASQRKLRRLKTRRMVARSMVLPRATKRRAVSRPSVQTWSRSMKMTALNKAFSSAPAPLAIASGAAYRESLPKTAQVTETVAYQLAGYAVTTDGALARMWYSRDYTVKSPYAYVGQMRMDGEDVHVWMETTGNLLAGAIAEREAPPLPDIAALMERFPDGGLGVVIANPDDFAPPSEPAVEVVEFAEPSR